MVINHAAAATLLMERSVTEQSGLAPLVRLVAYGHADADVFHMRIGTVAATRIALRRAGLRITDLGRDRIE